MLVRDLVELLLKLDYSLEVKITDGYQCRLYSGDFSVNVFTNCHGNSFADIGVGGCEDE